MKRYLYCPGCSLRGTGKAYEESLLAVFQALNIELEELEDWNCCGATAYMAIDEVSSFALAGRNLAIAEKKNLEQVVPPRVLRWGYPANYCRAGGFLCVGCAGEKTGTPFSGIRFCASTGMPKIA